MNAEQPPANAAPPIEPETPQPIDMYAAPGVLTIMRVPKPDRATFKTGKVFVGDRSRPDALPVKHDFSAGKYFSVASFPATDLQSFGAFVETGLQAVQYAFLMRAAPIVGTNLASTPRQKIAFVDVPRLWAMIDVDHAPGIPRGINGADHIRSMLPDEFRSAACWFQRTGSYGVRYQDRPVDDDPWAGRIRLGFWLSRPLMAFQLKKWLARCMAPIDLSFYDIVRPLYTSAPLFLGCDDPLVQEGEPRFGWLPGASGGAVDPVQVPAEVLAIEKSLPEHNQRVRRRHATCPPHIHERLIRELDSIENVESRRHADVRFWVCNAYGLGMDTEEIELRAATALADLRRGAGTPTTAERGEAKRLVEFAINNESRGELWVASHLCPEKDFDVVPVLDAAGPDHPTDVPIPDAAASPTLEPEEAKAQAEEVAPWWTQLQVNDDDNIKANEHNACVILEHHSMLRRSGEHCLAWDCFAERPRLRAAPPWWDNHARALHNETFSNYGYDVRDADYEDAIVWMQSLDPAKLGNEGTPIRLGKQAMQVSLHHVARTHAWNPVTDWMDRCHEAWDKKPRLADVPERVLQVHGMPRRLMQTYFKKWMVQAVRRAYKPGSKADAVLVLQGGEGAKKSTFLQLLCPVTSYFKEGLSDIAHKDALLELRGRMIVEFSEGFAIKKADSDALKAFITKTHDVYRDPFGISVDEHPRTCVFASCVNDAEFLPQVGGRRWWVLPVPSDEELLRGRRIDLVTAERERDMWWGEAVDLYRNGFECWLDDETDAAARLHNVAFSADADGISEVTQWLARPAAEGGPLHPDWQQTRDIWTRALKQQANASNRIMGMRVQEIMKGVGGWKKVQYEGVRGFVRVGSRVELDIPYRKAVFATLYENRAEVALDFSDTSNTK